MASRPFQNRFTLEEQEEAVRIFLYWQKALAQYKRGARYSSPLNPKEISPFDLIKLRFPGMGYSTLHGYVVKWREAIEGEKA